MKRLWLWFLAFFRLSDHAICTMSEGYGRYDYHDYPDSVDADNSPHIPIHKCSRCGKEFWT